MKLFGAEQKDQKLIDFQAMSGLNGQNTLRVYSCLLEKESRRSFIWLCDVDLASFNKTTLLNLTDFAEENDC